MYKKVIKNIPKFLTVTDIFKSKTLGVDCKKNQMV